ncbi:MAG: protein kinase [Vicinamibacterales bacterium]
MTLTTGTRLGHYDVVSLLGSGGMGEVYRARDTRPALAREVAIKVLSGAASDDESRRRFEGEARATGALNHPNILAIYDVGTHDGLLYLVEELVDGTTLREVLSKGPLPLRRAVEYGRAIAQGLAAAHAKNIIHRDLKPENVMVTGDGRLKILDFGLAKLNQPGQASDASTQTHQTGPGTILGTVSYMSPEQVRGQALDARSDLFSLGVVLYEMVSGRRPFSGETAPDTQAAILNADPPELPVDGACPPSLEAVIRRCLEKVPDQRFQTASDLAFALGALSSGKALPSTLEEVRRTSASSGRGLRSALPWVVAVVAILVSGLAGWSAWHRVPERETESLYASVTLPDGMVLGENDSTTAAGLLRTPFVFTPDGKAIVFVAASEGKSRLLVRPLDRQDSRLMTGTEGAQTPFISPDGKWVGFWSVGELRKIPFEGGAPTSIATLPTAPNGATWGTDDVIVFGDQDSGRIMRVAAAGGTPTPVSNEPGPYRRHVMPAVLPGGSRLLYSDISTNDANDSRLMVQALSGGPATVLVEKATDGRLVSPTRLVFMRLGTLMTIGFDASRATVLGDAVAALPGVAYSALRGLTVAEHPGVGIYAVSSKGALAVVRGPVMGAHPGTLVWATPSGVSSADPASGSPVGRRIMTRISPDGTRAVVTVQTPMRRELWFADYTRDVWTPCPDCLSDRGFAEWSPDGRQLLLGRGDTLVTHSIDGSSADVVVVKEENRRLVPGPWLRDGRMVYQSRTSADLTRAEIKVYDPASSTAKVIVAAGVASEPSVSPDGRWLAYGSSVGGQRENVFVQAFPGPGKRVQVSAGGGTNPAWSSDGRTLYYLRGVPGDTLFAADLTASGDDMVVGASRELFRSQPQNCSGVRCYDVALPGPRWLFRQAVPQASGMNHFDLIVNWADTLPTTH